MVLATKDDSAAPDRQRPCRVMRLLEIVTFSSVVKQSLSACLHGVVVTRTDPDRQSDGPSFRFFLAVESAQGHEPVPGQANMQNRFAMMCCHGRIGNHFGGVQGAIDNRSYSSTEPAISGLLPLRVHERTE